jgi:hypothetical protein
MGLGVSVSERVYIVKSTIMHLDTEYGQIIGYWPTKGGKENLTRVQKEK